MEKTIVLSDTSLCAIIRDEKMNPAGGIERFIDSHVPFVEQAVIADTGSIDGTREILEEMQARYSNLKVVDIPFNGYADARNRAMKYVQTEKILILDADELLAHKKPQNDWEVLKDFMELNPFSIYKFEFLAVCPDGTEYSQGDVHSRRLFDKDFVMFMGKVWEYAVYESMGRIPLVRRVPIKHFLPSEDAMHKKKKNWYMLEYWPAPSRVEGFAEWKEFNPLRDNYE